ncbi:T7SS effector LXG polymorphic toxin [Metabacillus idriensis]|uniref:ribonuclease YeeF family protein n=1 Tax=Metabacillus idriensis TaxID=324768 RepID=UPI002812AB67|nr:T7SS effector LXG polymorphic toxin [Metabacillus idriensis]MDR0139280.1 T7SS effector LXG polymorphic toxin [Metabacillus idriensis]
MAAIKVYEAKTLVSAMEKRAKQYEELKEQLNQLKKQFLDIVNSGDEFQGKGAEAIKGFYSAQVDVVEAWMRLIDKNIAFFKGIPGDAEDAKLSGDTFVQMSFIEENVPRAQNRAKEMVHSQQDALQSIFRSIDDLVPLHVFSTDTFEDHMAKAEKERTQTIDAVNQLDQALTEEYAISENDQSYLVGLFGQLLESSRQGSTITPINFDAKAYQNSEIYKMKKDIENSSKEYLSFKSDQAEARKQAKIAEELENRPWYEKLWDTTKTFTGEVSGYYDYKRATEGVDPVTGEKLTDAQRIAAGAMAAAGFIPVVGWAGRAAKGGSAIYKTVKAYNAADHALDAYKTSKSFSTLQKTEMGIYGLVSANGLGEAVTGKDMFGNQLTEEQRTQSLFNAFAILGVAGAGYGIDRLAARKVPTTKAPYSNKYVQEKLAVAQHTLKTIGSRIGDLPVPVKVTVQEMRTNTGFGVKQVYVETKSVRDVMQMSSSVKIRGKVSGKVLDAVPSVRNGEFRNWFNSLTTEEFDNVWEDPKLRESIKDRLRHPGGLHEWHLVSRADTFKYWGVTAEQITEMRTVISQTKFVNPNGKHGGKGSTKAHNELLQIIDTSTDYDMFKRRLQIWADYRFEGGSEALPDGLKPIRR